MKQKIRRLILPVYIWLQKIEGFFFPKLRSKKLYKKMIGKKCNLKNPTSLNEKLMFNKFNLYWDNLSVNKCADKYEVRKYVEEKGLGNILCPLLGVWDKFSDIDFDKLPDKFILKLSNGSGCNILCNDKSTFDKKSAKKKFGRWMRSTYGLTTGEQGIYRNVKKRIIAEALIETRNDMPPADFKFFCSYGEVKLLYVACDRKNGQTKFDYYTTDWKWIPVKNAHPNAGPIEKPKNYDLMMKYASILSKDFPLVRIDFYNNDGTIIFGEITFTHCGCVHPFDPSEYDEKFGALFPPVSKEIPNEILRKNSKKRSFRTTKWIFSSIALILNAFIVFYSCVPEEATANWNRGFTNIFARVVNTVTEKEVEQIHLSEINVSFSNKETHKYNYLDGYELNEIPLGSAKQIECSFLPLEATNKSITYSAFPSDVVQLNQSGSVVSVIGMKVGECVITAKSNDGGFESSLNLNVVQTIAPKNFSISLKNSTIPIGTTETIDFDIDGGVLGHNELINFRYYDTRELIYVSSNPSVVTIDEEYGVVYPQSVGNATISVSNGSITKSVDVSIVDGIVPAPISNLSIQGSNVCYSNDMILNQSYPDKYCYQLIPKDGDLNLNPDDFIWTSSNELLAKVDRHGVLRGFRKSSIEDENVVITAKSKIGGETASFNVTVKNQLPTELYHSFEVNGETTWNQKTFTFSVGDIVPVDIAYNSRVTNSAVEVECTDETVIQVTNEGTNLTFHILKPGTCTIKITSVINPELVKEIKCTVVKAGAISKDNYLSIGKYLRKSVGHAAVFMVAQIFTFLAIFMFLFEKKWWFYTSISLGEGLLISALSELIQSFVPSRSGLFLDVIINFGGVVLGAAIGFLIVLLINKIKNKKINQK